MTVEAIASLTSPTLRVGGNLLCRIVQLWFRFIFGKFAQRRDASPHSRLLRLFVPLICRRSGSVADSFAERNGSRADRRYRDAFRHSARSIARQRERDHLGRFRAKTNRARQRCASRSAGTLRCSNRNSRPVDVGFHARIAQRTHAGLARWHSDQSRLAGRVQFRRSDDRQYRPDRSRARTAEHLVRTARAGRRDSDFHQTRHRNARGALVAAEGGSYDTFREWGQSDGKIGDFDYSVGASRLDTDNARPNNQYRNTAAITDVGWSPDEQLRIGSLFTYSVSDTGNPNTIFDPRPIDHFLTERWLIGPHIDWKPADWWDHKLIFSYDHERQVNDPNEDGFVGPTRALFERTQVDYQNDLRPTSWLTLTSGFFYSHVNAGQERPFVLQIFGPQPTFVSDHTEEIAGFLAGDTHANREFDLCRRRALRSFQSIRRCLDLSRRRQLQDRQDKHNLALQCGDRIQSAEQSGQDFRE